MSSNLCYTISMKFVIIFGPQAVGKMTVGHELEKITDLKLLHNHMTIDLVDPFVSFGTDEGRGLVRRIRGEILKEVAAGDSAGIILPTYGILRLSSTQNILRKYLTYLNQRVEKCV